MPSSLVLAKLRWPLIPGAQSVYWRTIADLPWEGITVRISLRARKFLCVDQRCTRRMVTGPAMPLAGSLWRSVAGQVHDLPASRTTLLHELRKRAPSSAPSSLRVLGIDEWAWKNGHHHGTMLCDLEQGRVIDLLPTRDSDTVAAWLRQHASVRSLERHRGTVREVRDRLETFSRTQLVSSPDPVDSQTLASQRTQQNKNSRLELYQQMTELIAHGKSQSEAAARVGLSLRTVTTLDHNRSLPGTQAPHLSSQVDAFGPYLEKRVAEGCTNASQLWREIKQHGYRGNISGVWRWLQRRFVSSRTSRK